MASEFQRTKLQDMFNAFDVNGDGCLEEEDFAALASRWGRLPRVRADGELAARVEEVLLGWWQHLSQTVDTDNDGRIDMDDLLAMVDRLPTMQDAVAATADTVFDAVDENGDGRISRNEHQRLIDLWHGQGITTGDVFDRLDQDADGHLSRSEFAALWIQFWISDDPDEPGNYVCGPVAGHSSADPRPRPAGAADGTVHRGSAVLRSDQPRHEGAPQLGPVGVARPHEVDLLDEILRAQVVAGGEGTHGAVGQVEVVVPSLMGGDRGRTPRQVQLAHPARHFRWQRCFEGNVHGGAAMAFGEQGVLVPTARWEDRALSGCRVHVTHGFVVPVEARSLRYVEGHRQDAPSGEFLQRHRPLRLRVEEFPEHFDGPLGAAEPVLEPAEVGRDDLLCGAVVRPVRGLGGEEPPQIRQWEVQVTEAPDGQRRPDLRGE